MPETDTAGAQARRRRLAGRALTAAAAVVLLAVLLVPNQRSQLTPAAVLRIPAEGVLAAALVLALPARVRVPVAALAGTVLGLFAVARVVDMGFYSVLARPFDPVLDWSLLAAAVGFLTDAVGRTGALAAAVAAAVLAVTVLALAALSAVRLAGPLARHRRRSAAVLAVLGAAWTACAVLGAQIVPGAPVAAHDYDRVRQVSESLRDRYEFRTAVEVDPFADTPGTELLTALRGKDVVVAYVESYGRVALEHPELAVPEVLAGGERRLAAAGFEARSAFLSSPVVGGGSWLAHATLRSGLWVDNQQRYDLLVDSGRMTLNHAFQRAGWRTVGVMPGIFEDWPEGRAFGYDRIYPAEDLHYQGPRMNWGIIPDQYTLSVFERAERAQPGRPPVMAEIPLLSSHVPWFPIPSPVSWDEVGDGTVFESVPAAEATPDQLWRDPADGRAAFRRAVGYTIDTLVSYLETYGDEDLVLIFLGDHQPSPVVTGGDTSPDVPVSIVAGDPGVLDRIAGWGWHDGLRPGADAPVQSMGAFRDRFLTAFGPAGGATG